MEEEYREVAFSTELRSRDLGFLRALSFALKTAYPAAVSARINTIAAKKRGVEMALLRKSVVKCRCWKIW